MVAWTVGFSRTTIKDANGPSEFSVASKPTSWALQRGGGGEVGLPLAQNASGEGLRASCLQFPGSSRVVVPSPPHRASPSIYNCTSDNLFIIIYLFICLWMYLCEGPGVLEDPVLGAVPDSRVFCENRAGLSAPPTRPPRLTAFLLLMFKTNYLCNPVVLMLIW